MKTRNKISFIKFFLSHIKEYWVWIFPYSLIGIVGLIGGISRAYNGEYFRLRFIAISIFLIVLLAIYLFDKIVREYKYYIFQENLIVREKIVLKAAKIEIEYYKTLITNNNGKYLTKEFDKIFDCEVGIDNNKFYVIPFRTKKIRHYLKPILISDSVKRRRFELNPNNIEKKENETIFWFDRNKDYIKKITINIQSYNA